ncbi:PREDICTED: complement decay-accelerating factor, partial [Acanthisitta chloris]|uniref:complement decay-accelerating factor n=1 Tax=Acanthisitta chloris TaxID=57068 RepID=UPI0004F0D128
GCGTPTVFLFAELNEEHKNQTEFPVGGTVKYTCRPGYVKQPQISPTITCLENQTWSEAQEFCRRGCGAPPTFTFAELMKEYKHLMEFAVGNTVVCPAPEIRNGRIIVTRHRYTYKDTVSFRCHKGFTLRGHRTAQCHVNGMWHPPVPVCEQGR